MRKRTSPTKLDDLPEDCLRSILSRTSPKDVSTFATLSSFCRSNADSDDVWESFLPQNYRNVIWRSSDCWFVECCKSKKELFLDLAQNYILLDGDLRSIQLVRPTGCIKYMLSPRDLQIKRGSEPQCWEWIHSSKSRFSEVARLVNVYLLEIGGKVRANVLTKGVLYAVYFVFEFTGTTTPFNYSLTELSVGNLGHEFSKKKVYLASLSLRRSGRLKECSRDPRCQTNMRQDGLLEVEMGEFFNLFFGEEREIEMFIRNIIYWKKGLVVHGIEIRPKMC